MRRVVDQSQVHRYGAEEVRMFTHNRPITLVAVLFFTLLMLATALAVGQAADAASEFRIRILAQIKSKDSHGLHRLHGVCFFYL
jgi:hypothetical protein